MRAICRSTFAVAAMLTLAVPSSTLAQAAAHDALQVQMEETLRSAEIEANRAAFVAGLVERWAGEATARGMDKFKEGAPARLSAMSGKELYRLSRYANTLDDFTKVAFGGGRISVIGDITQDLVFFPVEPCRLLDTRPAAGATGAYLGPFPPNTQVAFSVNDTLGPQGGNALGCGIPTADPAALAVTITAANPSGPGNLRSFATGGAVPLAAMLNYTTGVSISTGAITASCSSGACSDELTVRNEGLGTTHIVVDVTGYFHAPIDTPLECQTVSSRSTILANNFGAFDSPACPAEHTLTGGGIDTNFSTAEIWVYRSSPNTGNTAWTCEARSLFGSDWPFFDCYAVCCKIPGR
jgi:hypothetical protein